MTLQAPGTNPAATAIPALAISSVLRVSWLADRESARSELDKTTGSMAGRQADQRLRRSSVRSADFRGQNTEAPPYPEARTVRRVRQTYWPANQLLGIDSRSTYRQALTGLSWLSYSRPETYSGSRACRARRPALLPWRLPTPADVERSL